MHCGGEERGLLHVFVKWLLEGIRVGARIDLGVAGSGGGQFVMGMRLGGADGVGCHLLGT